MELIQESNNFYKFTDDFIKIKEKIHYLDTTCFIKSRESKNVNKFLLEMYSNISKALEDFNKLKSKDFKVFPISSSQSIPKPSVIHNTFFPDDIQSYIDSHSSNYLSYNYRINKKKVSLKIITMENDIYDNDYYKYNEIIYVITHILEKYSSVECGKNLKIYIYFTDFKKYIPNSQLIKIDTEHVNSAYSDVCVKDSEIVIFRKEEWIKVLIHELFHNYGLDFSKMNYENIKKNIRQVFPIKSEFHLAESYAEFFGEMINIALTTYYLYPEASISSYIKNSIFLINIERTFSILQCVKMLHVIGLQYKNLYLQDDVSESLRKTIYYHEKTNIFCYYVLKMILMYYCDEFIEFCYDYNFQLLDFRKSETVLKSFYEFIITHYKEKKLLTSIENIEKSCNNINDLFCIRTARISCVEMD